MAEGDLDLGRREDSAGGKLLTGEPGKGGLAVAKDLPGEVCLSGEWEVPERVIPGVGSLSGNLLNCKLKSATKNRGLYSCGLFQKTKKCKCIYSWKISQV